MKRRIFSIFFALVLVLSFSLVTAVPVAAQSSSYPGLRFQVQDISAPAEGTASWVEDTHSGNYAVHLSTGTPDVLEAVDSARVVLPYNQALSTITEVGYSYRLIDGRPANDAAPYIYFELDTDETPGADTWVIHHMFVTAAEDQWGTWLLSTDTLDPAWHAAGLGSGDYANWAAVVTAFGTDTVLNIKIAVGEWESDHLESHHVDDFQLNGVTYDLEPSVINTNTSEGFNAIQAAINDADTLAGHTISVAEGIYDEQVLITKSLTLQGVGDTTIIQPPAVELTATSNIPWIGGGTGTMAAIVSVETVGGIVTVKNLKIDGSLIPSKSTDWVGGLVYLETSGKVEGVTVIGNSALPDRTAGIFAAAITNPASLEVTGCTVIGYNRAGIYALGGEFTADYHHNEINGPGEISTGVPNGIFFLRGAKGSATYNTVTDLGYTGEGEYRSTGIGTYNAGVDIVFSNNEISLVQNAFALSTGTIGTIVEYNNVHDCHTGVRIEASAASSVIQYNDIHDNDFAMRCGATMGDGNEAHYNNFVDNPGLEWINVDEDVPNTYVGAVCNVHPTYTLDAKYNWWGDISGPEYEAASFQFWPNNPGGIGGAVSDNVEYIPWLTRDFQTVLDDNICYFGFPMVQLDTGWNTFSTPIALDPGCDTWAKYVALGDGLNIGTSPAYAFDGEAQDWLPLIGEDADYELKPCDAIYVRMAEPDIAAILLSPKPSVPSKDLYAGWNLVSLASFTDDYMYAADALDTIRKVTGDLIGLSMVVSPPVNCEPWFALRGDLCGDMYITEGYWVFMKNPGTLAGFSMTPIPLR